jgi:hypothetical protein
MGDTSHNCSYGKFRLFEGGSSAPQPEAFCFLSLGWVWGKLFGGRWGSLSLAEKIRIAVGTVFKSRAIYLNARPSGRASPSLPTGEGEAYNRCQRHPTRPKQPLTFAGETRLFNLEKNFWSHQTWREAYRGFCGP